MMRRLFIACVYHCGLLGEALLLNSQQLLPRPKINIYYSNVFPGQEEIDELRPNESISLKPASKYEMTSMQDISTNNRWYRYSDTSGYYHGATFGFDNIPSHIG